MQLMCHRVRECSAHCCKTNKSGVADMFRIFFSLTGIWSTWTLWWTRAHWKEMILNHQKEMLVQRVVCVICTGWLANHSLLLKSWKHVNLADQVVFSFLFFKQDSTVQGRPSFPMMMKLHISCILSPYIAHGSKLGFAHLFALRTGIPCWWATCSSCLPPSMSISQVWWFSSKLSVACLYHQLIPHYLWEQTYFARQIARNVKN